MSPLEYWVIEESKRVISIVSAAFKDVLPPERSCFLADGVDESNYYEVDELTSLKAWVDIAFEDLIRNRDALSFVSAEAYKFLIPAFISEGLQHLSSGGEEILNSVIFSLAIKNPFGRESASNLQMFASELNDIGVNLREIINSHDENLVIKRLKTLSDDQTSSLLEFLKFASMQDAGLDYDLARLALAELKNIFPTTSQTNTNGD